MPFGPVPEPPDKARYSEVRQEQARIDQDRLFPSSASPILLAQFKVPQSAKKESARKSMHIENHGQIKSMPLPSGWLEAPSAPQAGGIGSRSLRVFHAPGKSNVKITFFYRGLPMSEESGTNFHNILSTPAHKLAAAEIAKLGDVLEELSEASTVELLSACTEDLNGKRVLHFIGTYKEKQNHIDEIFIDTDGTGRAVQEIYFFAPKAEYQHYLKEITQSFASIHWN